jgi:hypothetical protein
MRFQREIHQAMLRLRMRQSAELLSAETRQGWASEAKRIQNDNGSIAAVRFLFDQIGTELLLDRDESYYAEALEFHLGLLEAYCGRPEAMAAHIQRSHTMPGPEDDRLYSDHVAISTATRRHQLHAIANGIPAVLIACMPRSASATLVHSLANMLDAPFLHTSIGRFPDYFIAPSWLDMFLEGGAVTQDHFMLDDFNAGVLKSRGQRDIFVTIRDPRAAARSWVHWLARWDSTSSASIEEQAGARSWVHWLTRRRSARSISIEEQIERECKENFIPWLQSWLDWSHDKSFPHRIHLIKFADITGDLKETVHRIARIAQGGVPATGSSLDRAQFEELKVHFKEGDDNAWRSEVSEATAKRLWEACSPEIRELLRLNP